MHIALNEAALQEAAYKDRWFMREKIKRLANGALDKEKSSLMIEPIILDYPIKSGEIVTMDIRADSTNHLQVKGLVYSNNHRVKIITPSFCGMRNIIKIEIDSRFLKSDAIIEGDINLVTGAGEYQIPFEFRVYTGQTGDVLSELRTIEDFLIIAKEDKETALRIFEYKEFVNAPFMDDIYLRSLYTAFSNRTNKQNALEEFLIAARKKEAVIVTAKEKEIDLGQVGFDLESKLTLCKNTWGYLGFAVSVSDDFIEVKDKFVTEEDFLNNEYEFCFTVKKNRLHRGKNEAMIRFISVAQTVEVPIYAFLGSGEDEYLSNRRLFFKNNLAEYSEYRLLYEANGADRGECLDRMLEALDRISNSDEKAEYIKLLRAETYLLMGSKSKAADIVDTIRHTVTELRQELIVEFLLLEYIDARLFVNDGKRAKLTKLMRKMILEAEDLHLLIAQWMDLDENLYDDPSSLFEFFRILYQKGCRSPFLYIKYCNFLSKFPEFLHDMGDFEIHALYCASRYGGIGKELAKIVAKRAGYVRLEEGLYFSLLKRLYKEAPEREFLHAVCAAFVKSNVFDPKVLSWYEEGVVQGIHIYNLYESYMYSIGDDFDKKIPESVLYYFTEKRAIDSRARSILYENVLKYYAPGDDIYNHYIAEIEKFAIDQLRQVKINRHLAFIYNKVLRPEMMDAKLAETSPPILSAVRVENKNPLIKSALVIYPQLVGVNEFHFSEGDAFIPVSTDDAIILLQDAYGNRYSRFDCNKERVMDSDEVLRTCYRLAPKHLLERISHLQYALDSKFQTAEDASFLEECMKKMQLSPVCKEKVLGYLVKYYKDACLKLGGPNDWTLSKNDVLLSADKSLLSQEERTMVCETLVILGYAREAYEMIRLYDCDRISSENLARLCIKMIAGRVFTDEPLLLLLVFRAIKNGSKDSLLLEYAARRFNGSSEDMFLVLKTCMEEHIQSGDLDERLLAQVIFADNKQYLDQVFSWYVGRKKTSEELISAFFTLKSCHFFIDGEEASDSFFEFLERAVREVPDLKKVPVIYQLAITKYYAGLGSLGEERVKLCRRIVGDLIRNDIVFDYFKDLPESIKMPNEVLDKSYVIYYAKNRGEIRLRSRISPSDRDFYTDEMRKMVLDYYIKERILFQDEIWDYHILDVSKSAENILQEGSIRYAGCAKTDSRFDSLNQLQGVEGAKLFQAVENYIIKEEMSKALFDIRTGD